MDRICDGCCCGGAAESKGAADVRLLHPSSTCVRVKNHYPESSLTCLFENSES
jgi:hypothetical protein